MTDQPSPSQPSPGVTQPTPPTQTINIQQPLAPPTNGMAVAALVLGIVALLTFLIPFLGWIPAIIGLVLGLVAMQRPYGRGMAVAGVICSAVALVIKVSLWVVFLGIFGAAAAVHA